MNSRVNFPFFLHFRPPPASSHPCLAICGFDRLRGCLTPSEIGSRPNGVSLGFLKHCQVTETADLENHVGVPELRLELSANDTDSISPRVVALEQFVSLESVTVVPKDEEPRVEQLPMAVSPEKGYLSRSSSFHAHCRICQHEKEEVVIVLGCKCRGDLAKAHLTCIKTWFQLRGSRMCEICKDVAENVPPPPQQSNSYWVWRINPTSRTDRERSCFSPLWVAFAILVGGLLLDVLISITIGVSALPVNIIIGVIVVLGLGTALRLALEFCHQWSLRRAVQGVETNVNLGFYPAL